MLDKIYHPQPFTLADSRPRLRPTGRIPLVFSRSYDLSLASLTDHLPLDLNKRQRVYDALAAHLGFSSAEIAEPLPVTPAELRLGHTAEYLRTLDSSEGIARAFGLPMLRSLPAEELRTKLLSPLLDAVGGTMKAVDLALECGWAVNLSGGFHHAHPTGGGGLCIYNDVVIAVRRLLAHDQARKMRVLIVDFDAHQSNGVAHGLSDEPRVALLDLFNSQVFPGDEEARAKTRYPIPVASTISDHAYLDLASRHLLRAIADHEPNLLMYIAGADVAAGDPVGRMHLSPRTIRERDLFVTTTATRLRIPWCLLLGGGYGPTAHEIISSSLASILGQFDDS